MPPWVRVALVHSQFEQLSPQTMLVPASVFEAPHCCFRFQAFALGVGRPPEMRRLPQMICFDHDGFEGYAAPGPLVRKNSASSTASRALTNPAPSSSTW